MNESDWIREAFEQEVQNIGLQNRTCTLIDASIIWSVKGHDVLTLTYSYESDKGLDDRMKLRPSKTVRYAVFVEGKPNAQVSGIVTTEKLDKSAEKQ